VTILSNFLSGLLETDAVAPHGSENIAGFPPSPATHANPPLFRPRRLQIAADFVFFGDPCSSVTKRLAGVEG